MSVRILIGDVRAKLAELPDESVHCVVTSPPYFGLRDYGTASWEGGDAACDHIGGLDRPRSERPLGVFHGGDDKYHTTPFRKTCNKCGAVRADKQIGLEDTPAAFVEVMVAVFREVRRVMRPDATLWLNLGDSYAGGGTIGRNDAGRDIGGGGNKLGSGNPGPMGSRSPVAGLKAKDLIGIPWRVAFALQADGWYLRQDIIWSKPNPMPESVTDRCTKAHEYLFLLSKGPRYHYDADAIKEAAIHEGRVVKASGTDAKNGQKGDFGATAAGFTQHDTLVTDRNKRSVWTVTTQPFSEAHFATFPPALIEPCILAGCPKGGTVLDPFFGAGTTGLVADRLGRNAIGIELNAEYAEMARSRIKGDAPMFTDVVAA